MVHVLRNPRRGLRGTSRRVSSFQRMSGDLAFRELRSASATTAADAASGFGRENEMVTTKNKKNKNNTNKNKNNDNFNLADP